MASSLSNPVDNLAEAEAIHKTKCKYDNKKDMIIKKCETCAIKYKDCECCLQYTIVNDVLIEYKCLFCNKNYQKKKFEKNFKKRDLSIHTNINKYYVNRYPNLARIL